MESTQFYLQEFLDIVIRRKGLILFFLGLVVVVVTLGTLRQPKVYKAETIVEVGAETPDIAFYKEVISDLPQNWWTIQTYYETQYKIIKSRYLLSLVAERIINKKLMEGSSIEGITAWLQGSADVKPQDKSRLVSISIEDTVPERAAQISDLIADTYAEENLNRKIKGAKDAVENLSKQLDVFRGEKERSDQLMQKFKEENKIVALENRETMVKDNMLSLNETLNKTKNERILLEASYNALKQIIEDSGDDAEKIIGAVASDLMSKLKMEYDSLMREYGEMSTKYKEKHPLMVEVKAKIDEVTNSIKREARSELAKLGTSYNLIRAQEISIAQHLDKQKSEALRIDSLNLKLETIGTVQASNKSFYEGLTKKLKEADLTGLIKSNNIRVIDRALVPKSPIKPNLRYNIIMAFVFGILGGIGVAYLIESMDNTIKTEQDVEKYTGVPLLGVIPMSSINGKGEINVESTQNIDLLPLKEPTSNIAEMYRTIRTNIAFIASSRGYQIFQITSAGAREGKTTTAVNVASTIAQFGGKTLLIDLDLRRSRMNNIFNLEREKGITDYLIGAFPLEECIKRTEIPHLDIITTGTLPPNPAELVASFKLKEALERLKKTYASIIIDSSPIVPVTDSLIMAQLVDAVILVVGAEKTGRHILKNSKDQLSKVNANIVGTVLNGVNLQKKKYLNKYSSYGYYGKGYYYKNDEDENNLENDKRVDA